MENSGPDLALNIIPCDGEAGIYEALGPLRNRGNERGNAINECTTGFKSRSGVELSGLGATYRKIVDEHICLRFPESLYNVNWLVVLNEEGLPHVWGHSI